MESRLNMYRVFKLDKSIAFIYAIIDPISDKYRLVDLTNNRIYPYQFDTIDDVNEYFNHRVNDGDILEYQKV